MVIIRITLSNLLREKGDLCLELLRVDKGIYPFDTSQPIGSMQVLCSPTLVITPVPLNFIFLTRLRNSVSSSPLT